MQIDGKKITDTNELYHYKSYIEFITSNDKNAKAENGAMGLFFKDTPEHFNEIATLIDGNNKGANNRFKLTKYGKLFEAAGRIHNDFFAQNKYIPGDIKITVTFFVNNPKFYLMGHADCNNYKFKFEKCSLMIKRYEISSKIVKSINEKREKKALLTYPVKRGVIRYKTIPPNLNSFTERMVTDNELPKRIIVGMVHAHGFSGSLNNNPYYFQDFGIQKISVNKGPELTPFMTLDELDFDSGADNSDRYLKAYISLLKGTGRLFQNESLDITPNQFRKGQTLFVFDLSKNGIESETFEINENGSLTVNVTLKANIAHSIVLICYLEYDSIIAIGEETTVKPGGVEID